MAHLSTASQSRIDSMDPAWLAHCPGVATLVNDRAGRTDIVAYIGDDAGAGHAACFYPGLAQAELNVQAALAPNIKPAQVTGSFAQRATLFEWPKAAGALIHEASHARWTLWDLQDLAGITRETRDPRIAEVIERFEETRIERMAAREWPQDRGFLRASAMGIVMDDIDLEELEQGKVFSTACCLLVTVARYDAGVLEWDDVLTLDKFMSDFFTPPVYAELKRVYCAAMALDQDHENLVPRLRELAEEFIALLPDDPEGAGDDGTEIMIILGDAQASAEMGGEDDAAEQGRTERAQAVAQAEAVDAQQARENQRVATQVFGRGKNTDNIPNTSSRVIERREPSPSERQAAVELGRQLEKVRYQERLRIETHSIVPPGRLDTAEAIRGLAQRQYGRPVTATPWRAVQRRHVEDPNLSIGVATDISGSMHGAMEPMAVTSWLLADAGYRIQAQVAQVYFGNTVFPTLEPGERLEQVTVRSASDMTHRFDRAFKALDGALNLTQGAGARLFVLCSDTYYDDNEVDRVRYWTSLCIRRGVGVIILPYDDGATARSHGLDPQVRIVPGTHKPVKVAELVGQAAIEGLAAVSANR